VCAGRLGGRTGRSSCRPVHRVDHSSCLQDAELLQRRCAVVEPDLFGDLAVLDSQNGHSRKMHFPARAGGKRADEEVIEGRAGVRAAAFRSADNVVVLGDQVGCTSEIQVRTFFRRGAACSAPSRLVLSPTANTLRAFVGSDGARPSQEP
jgi:hypothetical protein